MSHMLLDENATVDYLKVDSCCWNIDLLQRCFIADDVDMILSIPSSNSSMDDSMLWHFEKDGMYLVRSGYRVRRNLSSNPSSSGLEARRGVTSTANCPCCHRGLESMCHTPFRDVVILLSNQVVHNLSNQDVRNVVSWASDFISKWRLAQGGISATVMGNVAVAAGKILKWGPPTEGVFKINTDATTSYTNRTIGYGVIIRDRCGYVKVSAAQQARATFAPLVEEAMAVWNGVLLAVKLELVLFQIETDSLQVVNLVNSGD
ncbi:hypothetical protein Dsin_008505 [Dipteronia sinensis]|uniref:RNase H type-1 domain-containing protein n=1 Tax=Dipteronia sinensis TaxID=43782 RepID=A0AAE0API0_9ROSI|nr:hypothetical protein Dsin_008505 [Dipteronia sinensis]